MLYYDFLQLKEGQSFFIFDKSLLIDLLLLTYKDNAILENFSHSVPFVQIKTNKLSIKRTP